MGERDLQRAESQQLEKNDNKPMSYFNIIGNTRIKDERVRNKSLLLRF